MHTQSRLLSICNPNQNPNTQHAIATWQSPLTLLQTTGTAQAVTCHENILSELFNLLQPCIPAKASTSREPKSLVYPCTVPDKTETPDERVAASLLADRQDAQHGSMCMHSNAQNNSVCTPISADAHTSPTCTQHQITPSTQHGAQVSVVGCT